MARALQRVGGMHQHHEGRHRDAQARDADAIGTPRRTTLAHQLAHGVVRFEPPLPVDRAASHSLGSRDDTVVYLEVDEVDERWTIDPARGEE